MTATLLATRRVDKPWGRHDLWPGFDDVPEGGTPIGEIWFQAPKGVGEDDPELLIKYLFTADRLSVQVHPDDAYAHAHGLDRGKSEAWQILAAEPHATIAIGTLQPMTKDELRESAEDGTIVDKLDWKAVKADQFWYSPAGTVHAIGPGLVLIEVQQNIDLTYRLYDYGSDRELHLDDGVASSHPVPYVAPFTPYDLEPGRRILSGDGAFVTERWTASRAGTLRATKERPVWLVPLKGEGSVDGDGIGPGGVWLADSDVALETKDGCDLLLAYPGGAVEQGLLA
jgi:mannose-6-phosphate isomerase